MPIVFGFLCLQLVVKLITTIYTADQHHSMQGKINFFIQVGSLLLIWIMTKTSESSLLVFGVIFSALPVVILLWFNLFAFNNRYIDFKPSIKLWKKEYLKEIFGLGFIFFVIQISGIVLYTTDNFIISKLFSPKEVVPYTIAFKYISISSMLFSIIATPYWSSINEAFNRKDFEWIKKAMKNLKKMSFIFVFLIFFMVIISKLVYQFWIGTKISIPSSLTIFMALFIVSSIIVTPYTIFLNGTGKIKIQAIQSVIAALINIPLSIFFAKTLNIGVNGIILATIVCFIPSLIFSQIQYSKIINNKAFGIWNK
jgi:O-antigen/teichoic acid export membrane protein